MSKLLGRALTVALIVALVGCTGRPSEPPPEADATFVYDTHLDVITDWDPATSYSNELVALQNVYETLTRYDPRTKAVQPRLATAWSASPDGRTWTFTLRTGVRFHTGRPFDAAAAKAAIERTVAAEGGAAYIWDAVRRIEAPAADRLVFRLRYPAPLDLISSSAYAAFLYDVRAAGSGDLAEWFAAGRDAGTGPYTVGRWAKGEETELTLTAVDDYWGGWPDRRYASAEFRVTPETTTSWQLLQRGEVTCAKRLTPSLYAQAGRTAGLTTSATPSFTNLLALLNTASGPLTDVRLRRAVLAAVDAPGLVSALQGSVVPADGIVPDGLLGDRSGTGLVQDLDLARRLLAEAGYGPGGRSLSLTMTYAQGDDDQQLFATLLGSALGELGVRLTARPMQWNAQWDRGKSREPADRQDIFVMYWYPDYADPYSWFVNVFRSADPPSFNLSYLHDATVDAQIDALPAATATDRATARQAYLVLQRELIRDEAVVAPLFVQTYQRACRAGLAGYVDNPAYPDVVFFHDVAPGD